MNGRVSFVFLTFLGFLTGYRDPYGIVRGAANAPSASATRWQFGQVNSFLKKICILA